MTEDRGWTDDREPKTDSVPRLPSPVLSPRSFPPSSVFFPPVLSLSPVVGFLSSVLFTPFGV